MLAAMVDKGWDIVTPIPSCTLMFKQELPLMFPDDPEVIKVRDAMFDPFEYLMLRHKDGQAEDGIQASRSAKLPTRFHATCACRISA